jgi:PKD repeat protein
LGNNNFIISNISSNFRYLTSAGAYGNILHNNPDDLRGPVMPPSFTFLNDTVCVRDTVTWTMGNAPFAWDTAVYHWGDGTSSTVFPAGPATHVYATAGNFTTYAVLKNDTVGLDTMKSAPLRVNGLPIVSLIPDKDTTLCFVDSLHLVGASGGALQWFMNGAPISGATTASYDVTTKGWYNQLKINQNGCRDSAATGLFIQFGDQPTANLGSDSTICDGDTLCLGLNNPTGVTYLWSTGSTLNGECFTTAGTYSVIASDSVGCEAVDSILINLILAPDINVSIDSSNCPTLVFNANDPNGTNWDWTFGDGNTATGNPVTHTYTANGSYGGIVVASNQCFSVTDSGTINIDCIVAVDPAFANAIQVSPNPSNGHFLLNASLPMATSLHYKITDISGRRLLAGGSDEFRKNWTESIELNAAPGIYFLTVEAGAQRAVYQIVVQ